MPAREENAAGVLPNYSTGQVGPALYDFRGRITKGEIKNQVYIFSDVDKIELL